MPSPWRKGSFDIRRRGRRRRVTLTGWIHTAGYGVDCRDGDLWIITHLATGYRLSPVFVRLADARAAVRAIVRDVPELGANRRPSPRLGERVLAAIQKRECL